MAVLKYMAEENGHGPLENDFGATGGDFSSTSAFLSLIIVNGPMLMVFEYCVETLVSACIVFGLINIHQRKVTYYRDYQLGSFRTTDLDLT